MSTQKPSQERPLIPRLPALSVPGLVFEHRAALSMILVPTLVLLGDALVMGMARVTLDRAHLTEAITMLGHARKDLTVELALQPADATPRTDAPVVLSSLPQPKEQAKLPITYEREGERLLARFGRGDEHGVWILEPVDAAAEDLWVLPWRCRSQSGAYFGSMARGLCPAVSASSSSLP